ncbi:MAG: TolC family protein [bacterium]|nr:TolC family protein [bacterium]
MDFLPWLLERRRLTIASALLLAAVGVFSWLTMPREEDPQFPERDAVVITAFPGADAETVERLVIEPLEEHLAEIEELREVYSTARAGVAIIRVELHETVYATDDAWDEVSDALKAARAEFPDGVAEPTLDHEQVAQEAIVLALTGSSDPLVLAAAAERVKRRLLALDPVRRVKLIADPGEQITIEYDDATARRLGVDPRLLGYQLAQRSAILPGGLIHLGAKTATLRPQTEFASVAEMAATPILLPSGSSIPLGALARVRRGPREPPAERMRWNGELAVGLGLVPVDGIDRIELGRRVRRELRELAPLVEPLRISEVIFQPDQVESRLNRLTRSLRFAILIVAGVLFLTMGLRLGLLVALILPLVVFGSIGIFATGGGILHQVSIAALVIALGMLVDNAIVVAEAIQWRLDRGVPVRRAAVETVRELLVPLGSATGTTLAAFVPMLLSRGNTADFTRTLPILIMLTLTVSYLFAILVTPTLGEVLLRPARRSEGGRSERLARRIAAISVGRSGLVLIGAAVLLALTVIAAGRVDREFFPAADRNVMLVDLQMPEGTHLDETDAVAHRVETALAERPEVASVVSFIGRAAPHFYYNLLNQPASPHRAQVVVETDRVEAIGPLLAWARELVRRELPEVEVVARRLEQGPPVEAPIEVRLFGSELEQLETAADAVLAEMRAVPGTRDVRHDLGLGVPTVVFRIDDAAAARHGLSRSDVALVLLGRTLGSEIGQFRVGEDPVPILVRSSAGEEYPVTDLATIDVAAPGRVPVPLAQLARLEVQWRPAAIRHRARTRIVKVLAQLADGVTASQVLLELEPRLAELALPDGVRLEYGGEFEGTGDANAALLRTMPLGVLLLLFFLLSEFNSFRRVGIILVTVPLAATGVVPGLLLSGQPFGFMSTLGVMSLVGIVVNNAIVLLDVVESRRAAGATVEGALTEAIARRTRPILLTMATTVAGLSPLAFSGTSLWPPLAWAMISGLMASTLLTLLVVPALYKLLFTRPAWPHLGRRRAAAGAAMLVAAVVTAGPAGASGSAAELPPICPPPGEPPICPPPGEPPFDGASSDNGPKAATSQRLRPTAASEEPLVLTLDEAIARAVERPQAAAAASRAAAAELGAGAEWRAAVLPVIGISVDDVRRDRDFLLATPLGDFTLGERHSTAAVVELVQPILDPVRLFYSVPAARSEADAETAQAMRIRQQLVAEAAQSFLVVLGIDARIRSTDAFIAGIEARLAETEERVGAGRTLEADALKVRLDLEAAELDRLTLAESRRVATRVLGRAVGWDGAVEPRFDGDYDRDAAPVAEELAEVALAARPDVAALRAQLAALELRIRAVRGERLPRLKARARWFSTDGDPFQPEEMLETTVNLTWSPFAAGTRAPRIAALEAGHEALEADLAELRRGVDLEIREVLARLATARAAVGVRERGVELAAETLRVERERHRAGRATTNDLLAAEAVLRRQRTESALARLDVLRAWVRLELAVGSDPLVP